MKVVLLEGASATTPLHQTLEIHLRPLRDTGAALPALRDPNHDHTDTFASTMVGSRRHQKALWRQLPVEDAATEACFRWKWFEGAPEQYDDSGKQARADLTAEYRSGDPLPAVVNDWILVRFFLSSS